MGDHLYLAPECEDATRGFQKGLITRKSDIWSFGCVIAELAMYMKRGADGVKAFKKAREVEIIPGWIFTTFHAGQKPNKGLQDWLEVLEDEATPAGIGLIQLVSDMLAMLPDDRPCAEEVTRRLRFLATKVSYDNALHRISDLPSDDSGLDLLIEKERFGLWGHTLHLADLTG